MPQTSLHHIQTKKTARYFTMGTLDEETQHIWLVLHGYGMLAEYFLRNFKNIQHPHNYIIAPEALSRFYLNQTTGRIGATWMTKEDREHEINDYVTYLNEILNTLSIPAGCKIHVLGFSQGAATACRWAMLAPSPIKTLICWAGFFPPDMLWEAPRYLNEEMKIYLLYGTHDEYVNDQVKKELEQALALIPKKPNIIIFEGKHEIVEPTLYTLVKTIENG